MTRLSLIDQINALAESIWFVPASGPTNLIAIRLNEVSDGAIKRAAESLECRYFIREGEAPLPPPISIPQEWLIFDVQSTGRQPVKRLHSRTIDAAHVWALTMQSGEV